MKKLGIMLIFVCILGTTGCQIHHSDSDNELLKAQAEVDKSDLDFKIPKLNGYEVSYVQHEYPPKDEQGSTIGNSQEVLVTYTKNKGKLTKLTQEQKANDDREIWYGPYEGDTLIEISYRNIPSDLDNSDIVQIGGEQVQKAQIGKHTFLLFNSGKGSITMNYNNLDEAEISRVAQQVIDQNP